MKGDEPGPGHAASVELVFREIDEGDVDAVAAEPRGRRRQAEWLMAQFVRGNQECGAQLCAPPFCHTVC